MTAADESRAAPLGEDPRGVTSIGRTVVVRGQVHATEHLIIEGRVEGRVLVPDHGVAIAQGATVGPEVIAKTITVLGTATGKLTASERIEVLPTGRVIGRLAAATLIVDEGAFIQGTVNPKITDMALAVAQHRARGITGAGGDP